MACQSEVIGEQFAKHCANHVICINKVIEVQDKASIEFTTNLYSFLFNGETVCSAYKNAIEATKLALGKEKSEAEEGKIFKIILSEKNHDC